MTSARSEVRPTSARSEVRSHRPRIGGANGPSPGSYAVVHFHALNMFWCQSGDITMTSVAPSEPRVVFLTGSLFSWH